MRKSLLIFSLSLLPLIAIIVLAGTLRVPVVGLSEPGAMRPGPEVVLLATEHPLLRPWFDDLVQFLQDDSALARNLSARYLQAGQVEPQTPASPEPFLLTFPHTANGSEGPGQARIVSSVLLLNNGGADAEGTITLRQMDGSPLIVNTNLGRGSQFDFALLSGEELRLVTDGSGSTQQGWVEVESDVRISGSGLFTVLDAQGRFISEVGIGDSVRATRLMVFVDTTNGKSTGVGISNPNSQADASLTYTLRGMDGMEVAQAPADMLAAGHQKAFFAVQAFPEVDLRNFKGVLVIESDVPVAVVTLRTRGLNFTSLPAVPAVVDTGDDEYTLYFPRIGDGVFGDQGFTTSIILLNNSEETVMATVELFRADGSPLTLVLNGGTGSSFEVEVPAGGAVELISDGSTNPGVVGWIQVVSDRPLGGGATFVITERGGGFVSEVGIASSPLDSKPSLVARVGDGVSTGFALTNTSDMDVVAKLRLVGNRISGASVAGAVEPVPPAIIAETTLNIGPRGHEGLFVSQVFPDVPAVQAQDFQGRLEIETFSPMIGESTLIPVTGLTLFLRSSPQGTFLTSAPLATFEVNFGPTTTFVPATLLAGAEPGFCLESRQLVGERPLSRAFITIDSLSVDLSQVMDSALIGKSELTILIFQLAAKTFMTEIQSDRALFFSPVSTDGESEGTPSASLVANRPEGDLQFVIVNNDAADAPIQFPSMARICFESGILQIPNQPGSTLVVREEYESLDLDPSDGGPFSSTRFSLLTLEDISAGAPRVDAIDARQVIGGQEILLSGSFGPNPAGSQVTVEGGSRVEGEVLSATADQLRVRLPFDLRSGPLRVESGGQMSNDYALDVLFAPTVDVTFSGSPGVDANLMLEVRQSPDQLLFSETQLHASAGEWITSGFTEGDNIGVARFLSLGGETMLDLLVSAVAPGSLTIQGVEPGDDDPQLEILINNNQDPSFVLQLVDDLGITTLSPTETRILLETSRPIFSRSGGTFNVTASVFSQPERVFFPSTALTVTRTLPQ